MDLRRFHGKLSLLHHPVKFPFRIINVPSAVNKKKKANNNSVKICKC